jgi:hypothetical protein
MNRMDKMQTLLIGGTVSLLVLLCVLAVHPHVEEDGNLAGLRLVSASGGIVTVTTNVWSGPAWIGYQQMPEVLNKRRSQERDQIDRAELIDAVQMQEFRREKLSNSQSPVPAK